MKIMFKSFYLKLLNSLMIDVNYQKDYYAIKKLRGFETGKVGPKDGMILLVEIMLLH